MELLGRNTHHNYSRIISSIPMFDGDHITFEEPIRFAFGIRAAKAVVPELEVSELMLKRTTGMAREYCENMIIRERLCWDAEYARRKNQFDFEDTLMEGFGARFCPPNIFVEAKNEIQREQRRSETTDDFMEAIITAVRPKVDEFEIIVAEAPASAYVNIHSPYMWGRLLMKHLILNGIDRHIHPWVNWLPKNVTLGEIIQRAEDVDRRRPFSAYRSEHQFNNY